MNVSVMSQSIWSHLSDNSWFQVELSVTHNKCFGRYTKSYYFRVLYIGMVCLSKTSECHVPYTKRKLKRFSWCLYVVFRSCHFWSWCFLCANIEKWKVGQKCCTFSKNDPYTGCFFSLRHTKCYIESTVFNRFSISNPFWKPELIPEKVFC